MFSWSVDIIVMLILIILMWVVIGLSVDNIVKDQESHTNRVVSKYADVSPAFVMVQSDNIPEDKVYYTCTNGKTENNQVCPHDLYGIRLNNTLRGVSVRGFN